MINRKLKLSICVDDILLEELIEIGQSHYPNEFGGFLIGNYNEDLEQINITNTILPIKYKATKYNFERTTFGIEEQLKDYYNNAPKRYYIGEWHTHPDNLPIPSETDINAINTMSSHKDLSIKNPVLLIIGYNKENVETGFYLPYNNKLYKYE